MRKKVKRAFLELLYVELKYGEAFAPALSLYNEFREVSKKVDAKTSPRRDKTERSSTPASSTSTPAIRDMFKDTGEVQVVNEVEEVQDKVQVTTEFKPARYRKRGESEVFEIPGLSIAPNGQLLGSKEGVIKPRVTRPQSIRFRNIFYHIPTMLLCTFGGAPPSDTKAAAVYIKGVANRLDNVVWRLTKGRKHA